MFPPPAEPGLRPPQRPGQPPDDGAGRFAPTHLLTLPGIAAAVPGRVEVIRGTQNLGPIALAMAAEGLLRESDLKGETHLLPIVTRAFERWTRQDTAGLQFNLRFLFTDDWTTHFDTLEPEYHRRDADDRTDMARLVDSGGAFVFGMRSDRADTYVIGPRCLAAQEAVPGLGTSMVRILERVLQATCNGFGPSDALGQMQQWKWGGEIDHKMQLEEIMGNICGEEGAPDYEPIELGQPTGDILCHLAWPWGPGGQREGAFQIDMDPQWDVQTLFIDAFDFSEYLTTKEEFHECLPEWACDWKAVIPRPSALRQAASALRRNPVVRAAVLACADLWELHQKLRPKSQRSHFYTISETCPPLVLCFNPQADVVGQMFDDRGQMLGESGEATEVQNIWIFDRNDPKSCRAAIRDVRKAFRLLHALQTTLKAVSTHIWHCPENH